MGNYRLRRPRDRANGVAAVTFLLSCIALVAVWGMVGVWHIFLNKDCLGYLKRAADSNSVELAQREMDKALTYIDEHNLTTGYTSVVYNTPDEDMSFWYSNLTGAKKELDEIVATPEATSLEKSNVLMKLRETLLDHGRNGEGLTYPKGLARYPYNGEVGILQIMLVIAGAVGFLSIRTK